MVAVRVNGGTGAGSRWRPDPTVPRCECGGFIERAKAAQGETRCALCRK